MTNQNIIKNFKTSKKMNITTDKLAKGMNRLLLTKNTLKCYSTVF